MNVSKIQRFHSWNSTKSNCVTRSVARGDVRLEQERNKPTSDAPLRTQPFLRLTGAVTVSPVIAPTWRAWSAMIRSAVRTEMFGGLDDRAHDRHGLRDHHIRCLPARGRTA
jgi:hypothetical protein